MFVVGISFSASQGCTDMRLCIFSNKPLEHAAEAIFVIGSSLTIPLFIFFDPFEQDLRRDVFDGRVSTRSSACHSEVQR